MLFDLMEFFIKTGQKYPKPEIKQWESELSRVLFDLLNRVKPEKIIKKIKSEDYAFVESTFASTKIVSHFKGMKNMLLSCKYVNEFDFWKNHTDGYMASKSGIYSETKKKDFKNFESILLFNECSHSFAINEAKIANQVCYCNICEEKDPTLKCNDSGCNPVLNRQECYQEARKENEEGDLP